MHQNVLFVSEDAPNSSELVRLLNEHGYSIHHSLLTQGNLDKTVATINPDFVIIHLISPEEMILELVRGIQKTRPTPIIIFADESNEAMASAFINAGASGYIVDGIEEHRLPSIIEVAKTRFNKCQSLMDKLSKTEQKLDERKDIDRAKGIIMRNKSVTEDEAYKMLRSLAMTNNKRIGELAKNIISAAELLN